MSYWQIVTLVLGGLAIVVGSLMGTLFWCWRRAEDRDGFR